MLSALILTITIAVFTTNSASALTTGECSTVPVIEDFDITKVSVSCLFIINY
jgi:hypothetical protein